MNDIPLVTVNAIDASFRPEEAGNCGLAVVAGDLEFSCAVIDFRKNKFVSLCHVRAGGDPAGHSPGPVGGLQSGFPAAVNRALPWLRSPFRMIRIAGDTRAATLVPGTLFNPDEKERYLQFNFTAGPGDLVQAVHLVPLGAWHVFTVSPPVAELTGELFPEHKIVPSAGLFIESILINYKNRLGKPNLFLHIRNGMFDLMIYDGRQMTYFNTFMFDKAEDVAYYLIFVLEQLGHNPDEVPLVAFGPLESCKGLGELLGRYIRHVAFGRRNTAYHYGHGFDGLPEHLYFPLLNFFSCGL